MTCCVRREAWPQAMRERRSRLDLATEESLTPAMRGGDRGRGERTREARFAGSNPHSGFNGVARHRARYGRRRPGVVAVRSLPSGSHTLLVAAVKHSGRRKTVRVASELFGWSRRARAVAMTWDVRGRFTSGQGSSSRKREGSAKSKPFNRVRETVRGVRRSIGVNLPKWVQANSSTLSSPLPSANSSG